MSPPEKTGRRKVAKKAKTTKSMRKKKLKSAPSPKKSANAAPPPADDIELPTWLDSLPLEIWMRSFRFWQWYHRYTVDGYQHILETRPALVVGYHGRPLALDMCMLQTKIRDDEDLGYLPMGMVHATTRYLPPLKWALDRLGFIVEDDAKVVAAVARKEHIFTTPGGEREGMRSFRQRYVVNWPRRTGYLRLAIDHALPIIPVAAAGADDTYVGLFDPQRLAKRLGIPRQLDFLLWIGFGPLGLYPFSPPFPVHIEQYIGAPYDGHLEGLPRARSAAAREQRKAYLDSAQGRKHLEKHHQKVQAEVQRLLDRAAGRRIAA